MYSPVLLHFVDVLLTEKLLPILYYYPLLLLYKSNRIHYYVIITLELV